MKCIVKIKFLGRFKTDVGAASIDIPIGGRASIKLLLKELRRNFKALSSVINDDGAPSYDLMVLVNGIDINVFDNLDELYVDDDDEILLVPITHGGRS
ncbi:MAG: MoaD/ThiS family protein [Ignisphaera sp.]|uniref:MoaD/ThiS family protein n=1 Tax=Ignisphaera aggregans TaxID=334771 RepID=A0A7J3JNU8_9CREN